MDKGTENVLIQDIQNTLRSDDEDVLAGAASVLVGKSTANQVKIFTLTVLHAGILVNINCNLCSNNPQWAIVA